MKLINLDTEEDKKEVRLGALLDSDVKRKLTALLREYVDVFAWSYQDMIGLKTDIVEHKLPLRPECPPVKQKRMKDNDEPPIEKGPEPGSIWGLLFDGTVNAYGHGIRAVIITPRGSHIPFATRVDFDCTNNIVEYEVCILGLEEAIDMRIKFLEVFGNSALIINQIKGERETRHPGLIPYRDYARRLSTFFTKVEFHHIPRDENQIANVLATLSSMYQMNLHREAPSITIQTCNKPAYIFNVEAVSDDKLWFYDIKCFLKKKEYPLGASNKDKKTLRRLSANFFLNGDVLYKRNFDMIYADIIHVPPTPLNVIT
ncbi:uncharacterized protein LOC127105874 [Lathyrus oleraceus]|uniref:uncharacterized protein LOC127105874 n=1 Tax=Pisum sativum TaxID=3888 RepID=UPI0021CE9A5E|nr:uncharacterized protein LOC127105874 [Pisum sativum]